MVQATEERLAGAAAAAAAAAAAVSCASWDQLVLALLALPGALVLLRWWVPARRHHCHVQQPHPDVLTVLTPPALQLMARGRLPAVCLA
jgi:cyanate permease